ncbi:MAG: cell division protein SepF [Oscillospiraceae bacterium]|jgi:cell division inhibitor SepF
MSLIDKFKRLFIVEDDDYEKEEMEQEEFISKDYSRSSEAFDYNSSEDRHGNVKAGPSGKSNRVVNIHATTQLQVVLVKPEHFEDASSVADHLNEKRTVVLNLESTNKDTARRLVDFLSGVAYANNGQIKRVANSTFIITPYNVDIMGDLLGELESNGLYF